MEVKRIPFEDVIRINDEYAARQLDTYQESFEIDADRYFEYNVQRGLRDISGNGVLVGLTNISTVTSKKIIDGKVVHVDGELSYRGYDIKDLIKGVYGSHFGFEEVAYLLLFSELPNADQLEEFKQLISMNRTLPTNFVRDIILKAPSRDIMNSMTRSVLTLASYDEKMADTSLENVLEQSIKLIAQFPMLAVWANPKGPFICLEPWFGRTDDEGFTGTIDQKKGMVDLEPGGRKEIAYAIDFL